MCTDCGCDEVRPKQRRGHNAGRAHAHLHVHADGTVHRHAHDDSHGQAHDHGPDQPSGQRAGLTHDAAD